MQHTLLGAGALPARNRPLLRAPRRHGGDLRRLRAGDAGRVGRRPHAVQALVLAGGHARASPSRGSSTPPRRPTRSTSRSARRPRPASRTSCRCTFRSRSAWSAPTAATSRCASTAKPRRSARRACSSSRKLAQSFRFAGIDAPPVPSLLRGFSAPVKVDSDYTRRASSRSSPAHDSDPVDRWDAAQRSYANAMLLARCAITAKGGRWCCRRRLCGIVARLLADRVSDPALIALALAPPDAVVCRVAGAGARRRRRGDGARVPHARARAPRCGRSSTASTTTRRVRASYAPSNDQTGARKLANMCLRYLGERRRRRRRARWPSRTTTAPTT